MTSRAPRSDDAPPAGVDVDVDVVDLARIAATDAPVLANLFELYAHDFSEHVPLVVHANGRFDVPIDGAWWTRDDHHPFFVRSGGALAGFALVRKGSRLAAERADVMDVAELFVLRGARRRGVGLRAVHALFSRFAAPWEIRVRSTNAPALAFWRRCAETWLGAPVAYETLTRASVSWHVLRLPAPPQSGAR